MLTPKSIIVFTFLFAIPTFVATSIAQETLNKTGTQWAPYLEWELSNTTYEGNPYNVIANVTFQHSSGETRTTPMFYAEDDTWKFRFTGTQVGTWTFTTSSNDPELNDKTGEVIIRKNSDSNQHGFAVPYEQKWLWQGTETAFVPQLVMYNTPDEYYQKPEKIDQDIQTFIVEHGFNGFHSPVMVRWLNINEERYDQIRSSDPNPDPRTFEALELLITKTHAAGGLVHFWAWGDESRHQTPMKWEKNGVVDQRLQRYIAARLGPIPGWSIGYGFDLDEWVNENDLKQWHDYMHDQLGWFHFLGGRSRGPNQGLDHKGYTIYAGLDYTSYEHHQPDYDVYVAALKAIPDRPVFSEDRFRIRQPSPYPDKDYTEELTRLGLWDSTMAGGVANIWGNLIGSSGGISAPYQNKDWIKTYSLFFEDRFLKDMVRDNAITDGYCLQNNNTSHYLFYKKATDSIQFDLSNMAYAQPAIAIDTKQKYKEIKIGNVSTDNHTWQAPYRSDWAIAVGTFKTTSNRNINP